MGIGFLFEVQTWSEVGCGDDGHTVAKTLRPSNGKL